MVLIFQQLQYFPQYLIDYWNLQLADRKWIGTKQSPSLWQLILNRPQIVVFYHIFITFKFVNCVASTAAGINLGNLNCLLYSWWTLKQNCEISFAERIREFAVLIIQPFPLEIFLRSVIKIIKEFFFLYDEQSVAPWLVGGDANLCASCYFKVWNS